MTAAPRAERTQVRRKHPVAIYAIGLMSGLYVNLGGQLYVAEIALMMITVVTVLGGGWKWPPSILRFTLLALLWGVGCTLSSLYNSSAPADTAKVLAGIAVTMTSLLGLARLVRSRGDALHAMVALALGQIVSYLVQPNPLVADSFWKFGIGFACTLLAMVVATRLQGASGLLLIAAAAAVNFALNFRSMTLILLMTLIVTFAAIGRGAHTGRNVLLSLPVAAACGWGLAVAYERLVAAGVFGHYALVKLRIQGGSTPFEMLLGGRRELFYSLPSILQSPVLGVGPSAKLTSPVIVSADRLLTQLGLEPQPLTTAYTLPTHSFLFGGWADAGILGLVFWLYLTAFLIRRLIRILNAHPSPLLVTPVTFLVILTLWNVLYSPYGATERTVLALVVVSVRIFESHSARKVDETAAPPAGGRHRVEAG